jgi:hypothetical protein
MSVSTRSSVSPFIAFCKANSVELRTANPTAKIGDIGGLMWDRWSKLSEVEKAVYRPAIRSRESVPPSEPTLRHSARLRNKQLGLDFWGLKKKN